MSVELDEVIRDAARSPGSMPDVDAAWRQGRRRNALRKAGASLGALAVVAALVVGGVVLAQQRPSGPTFLDDRPAVGDPADDEPATGTVTSTYWESLTAEQSLLALAEVADARAATYQEPEGLFYRYQKQRSHHLSVTPGEPPVVQPKVREVWWGSDGSGRIWETADGDARFLTPDDEAVFLEEHGALPSVGLVQMDFAPGEHPSPFAGVPTDAAGMERLMRDRAGPEPAPEATEAPVLARMRTDVTDMLREAAIPPDITAALLRVASDLELDYLGPTEDPEGRHVVGFAFDRHDGWSRTEVYLSPETAELLWTRSIALRAEPDTTAEPPFVQGEALFLENALVDEMPARPDGASAEPAG